MTKTPIQTTRAARLRQWFAARVIPAKEKSYLSQLMNGTAAAFGEKAARRLELTYGMTDGFLDVPLAEGEIVGGMPDGARQDEPPAGAEAAPTGGEPGAHLILAYIDLVEMTIISNYRKSTDIGKKLIETTAQTAKKRPLPR